MLCLEIGIKKRLRGKSYRRQLLPFGECVFNLPLEKPTRPEKLTPTCVDGVYMGLRDGSDELSSGPIMGWSTQDRYNGSLRRNGRLRPADRGGGSSVATQPGVAESGDADGHPRRASGGGCASNTGAY